jgi:hypothetical protein
MAATETVLGVILMVVMAGIVGVVAVKIIDDVGALINNTQARNIANKGLNSIDVTFNWLPLIVIVSLAGLMIYLLFKGVFSSIFGGRRRE